MKKWSLLILEASGWAYLKNPVWVPVQNPDTGYTATGFVCLFAFLDWDENAIESLILSAGDFSNFYSVILLII